MPDGLQGAWRNKIEDDVEIALLAEVPHERGERPDERGLPLAWLMRLEDHALHGLHAEPVEHLRMQDPQEQVLDQVFLDRVEARQVVETGRDAVDRDLESTLPTILGHDLDGPPVVVALEHEAGRGLELDPAQRRREPHDPLLVSQMRDPHQVPRLVGPAQKLDQLALGTLEERGAITVPRDDQLLGVHTRVVPRHQRAQFLQVDIGMYRQLTQLAAEGDRGPGLGLVGTRHALEAAQERPTRQQILEDGLQGFDGFHALGGRLLGLLSREARGKYVGHRLLGILLGLCQQLVHFQEEILAVRGSGRSVSRVL